jgi:hypothetical protein
MPDAGCAANIPQQGILGVTFFILVGKLLPNGPPEWHVSAPQSNECCCIASQEHVDREAQSG